MNKKFLKICILLGLCLISTIVKADYAFNMPVGHSVLSTKIYNLHMLIFWICVAIAVVVFGVMIYALFAFRKSKGAKAATFHENTKLEILWTVIPTIILVVMIFPASSTLIEIEDVSKADMTIKVTGWQWKWQYEYLDDEVSFFSNLDRVSNENRNDPRGHSNYLLEVDNRLVVPVNKRVRLLMTASDVIHSWWVPELGVKQDAIPGFINDAWFEATKTGVYRGQCTELCGKDHGFMPVVVEVRSEDGYAEWVDYVKNADAIEAAAANKVYSKEELMEIGKNVYVATCSACHGITGLGIEGAFPAIKDNDFILNKGIDAHIDIVMNGKAGTAMQAFKAQIADVGLAAVITYERNAFGNNLGDVIQPSDIKKLR